MRALCLMVFAIGSLLMSGIQAAQAQVGTWDSLGLCMSNEECAPFEVCALAIPCCPDALSCEGMLPCGVGTCVLAPGFCWVDDDCAAGVEGAGYRTLEVCVLEPRGAWADGVYRYSSVPARGVPDPRGAWAGMPPLDPEGVYEPDPRGAWAQGTGYRTLSVPGVCVENLCTPIPPCEGTEGNGYDVFDPMGGYEPDGAVPEPRGLWV